MSASSAPLSARRPTLPLAAAALLLLLLFSCSRPPEKAEAPKPAPAPSPSRESLAIGVSYVSGKVELLGQASAGGSASGRPLEPGEVLPPGSVLRTGPDGLCELSVGELGSLRILPGTTLSIRSAEIVGGSGLFRAELASGKVLAKARRLAGREAFMLSTPNAICGIRGTAFGLSWGGKRSLLAVSSGRVAVLPTGPLFSKVEAASERSSAARGLVRAAVALAPLVGEGEEVSIGPEEAARSEAAWARLAPSVEAGAPEVLPPEALIPAESVGAIGSAGSAGSADADAALKGAFPSPRAAGPEARSLLEALDAFSSGLYPGQAKAQPSYKSGLLVRAAAFERRPVASLLRSGELLVAGDGEGRLAALDSSGKEAWSFAGEGRGAPVLSKSSLYQASPSKLLVLDAESGRLLEELPLPGGSGARAGLAAFPDGLVAAIPSGLLIVTSAGKTREIPLGGEALAAAHYEGDVLALTASGSLLLLDPSSGAVKARAEALASPYLRVFEDSLALAGEKNGKQLLLLFSLPDLKKLASAELPFAPGAEPELNREGVLVWGGGRLAAFSPEGRAIGLIEGVSAPPLLSRGSLYYGTKEGFLVAARPSDLQALARLRLPAALSARPIAFGERLALPLADGSIALADPSKFEAAAK